MLIYRGDDSSYKVEEGFKKDRGDIFVTYGPSNITGGSFAYSTEGLGGGDVVHQEINKSCRISHSKELICKGEYFSYFGDDSMSDDPERANKKDRRLGFHKYHLINSIQ